MKHVFIVHGWGATPERDFEPWLRKALEAKGLNVSTPLMPNTDTPKISEWVEYLSSLIGNPGPDVYLVGHSMGCQAIVRYLATLKENQAVGGALLVAPFRNIRPGALDYKGKEVLKPWIETPIDWAEARKHCGKFTSIVSDNDPYIELADSDVFRDELGARTIVMPAAGHFRERDGYRELHVALNELLKMIGQVT